VSNDIKGSIKVVHQVLIADSTSRLTVLTVLVLLHSEGLESSNLIVAVDFTKVQVMGASTR
jgi:hypothetical protein